MRLPGIRISAFLPLLILIISGLGNLTGQTPGELQLYSSKYPGNSIILASLKEDLVLKLTDGKISADISESKEYIALNDNANYYADSRETFGSNHIFRNIEAYSLVPEKGGYRKIQVKNFKKSTESSGDAFYDDVYALNFTFPSVARGTRLISKIKASSDDPSFPYRFYFGGFLPCDEYIFTVTCPKELEIRHRMFGRDTSIIKFEATRKGGKTIYTWRASNPKSYIHDPLAPNFKYFTPHVMVQVSKYKTREGSINVNTSLDDLYKMVYKRISVNNPAFSEEIKDLTDSITRGALSDKDKVSRIFRWVQRNIKYIAIEDGENGFIPKEAGLVLQKKYGDCKDKTSLLVAMMKSQGLHASYAWIGTRDIPYKLSDFATSNCFDHMIAVWWDAGNMPVFLDGTTLHNFIEDIPSQIQGKECLIEDGPDKYTLYTVPVTSPERNTVYDSLTVELKGDMLTGTGTSVLNGYMRTYFLESVDGKEHTALPETLKHLMPKASNKFIIDSVKPLVKSDSSTFVSYVYHFHLPDFLTTINNTSYLNLNLDRYPEGTNLSDDRWIPVELRSPVRHIFICRYIIPDGYQIHGIPANSSYEGKLFAYNHSYEVSKNEIKVKTIVTLNFQVIEGDDIVRFREMLDRLNSNYIKALPISKTAEQ
jgi:hypothetical protein